MHGFGLIDIGLEKPQILDSRLFPMDFPNLSAKIFRKSRGGAL
jgi:hypothetical protein